MHVAILPLLLVLGLAAPLAGEDAGDPSTVAAPSVDYAFLATHCLECHSGEEPESGVDLSRFPSTAELTQALTLWRKVLRRVRDGEMPPVGSSRPSREAVAQFISELEEVLAVAPPASDVPSPPLAIRRLNKAQYAATIRDLLGIHFHAGDALPVDGAGGEGFDNAAETLFLSPLHFEKYVDAAREALDYAFKDPRSRSQLRISAPAEARSFEPAARGVLTEFLPRAFRRPTQPDEVERFMDLFRDALAHGEDYEQSLGFAMQAVLVSPEFLFLIEGPNPDPAPRPIGDFELASRLSYFLWGSMPDEELFFLAGQGRLQSEETIKAQAVRLLKDRKARQFAEQFVEQWLGTRELGQSIQVDRMLFPRYNTELEWAIKMEPVLFFQEIMAENHSVLELLDADYTFLNDVLGKHYALSKGSGQHLTHTELPEGSHRGGLLAMAAVLAVSSYPHRTSPVLRGKWVLETLLGSPPPPPPPNVPVLPEAKPGTEPRTLRERLLEHRQNKVCATCHERIDPVGFALENYDQLGRWRTEEGGVPIDSRGQLPDGTQVEGIEGLKRVLLERRDEFARHFVTKLLGYALGRGLRAEDRPTIDAITSKTPGDGYRAHALIVEIVLSTPFRCQPGAGSGPGLSESSSDENEETL